MGQLDKGLALRDVADGFLHSAEFAALYGANPSNTEFVTKLYANVLHRAYEQAGFDFWVGALAAGVSRADVLVALSESAENQLQVIGAIQDGFVFTPYQG